MTKTILITGASGGIGKEAAREFAEQGHTVIMHGRNPEKTRAACEEVKDETGNQNISCYVADLSLMGEVATFAERVKRDHDHLDVLVNNAGGQFGNRREVTSEGHERTLAINVLAPFLLTSLLLPLLAESPAARVVTMSSESYRQAGDPILDDIELERNYSLVRSYGFSKRYVWWIMRQFAVEAKKRGIDNVTFNTAEPGSAITGLQRVSGKGVQGILMRVVGVLWLPMMLPIEKAAAPEVFLATSPDAEGLNGEFWGVSGRPYGVVKRKEIPEKYISEEGQRAIWDFCREACAAYLPD